LSIVYLAALYHAALSLFIIQSVAVYCAIRNEFLESPIVAVAGRGTQAVARAAQAARMTLQSAAAKAA
jgi:hypothetical protein